MIRLQPSVLEGVLQPKSAQDLWPALQQAIELEHSTIPPYLYALYSLNTSANAEIAAILQSVVVEEMLHMTLSSNVLNALGGSPSIDRPDFIPKYPGPLPGGVQSDLTVHLAPFSLNQLDTFLQIEEPEDPIEFKSLQAMEALPEITIGQFYTAILLAIEILGDGAFVKPPRNQVGPDLMPESIVVYDVATAKAAITTIIEQGEGTSTSPLEVVGAGFAHYYRYMQIKKGNRLVKNPDPHLPPDQQYSYTGAPVPFSAAGVYCAPTDPSSAKYPAGSAQAFANDNFNYTYTSLLAALHAMFNGANTQDQFNRAIGLMMSLKSQAIAMMSGVPNPALLIGPSFEYLPVNP
ncbi:MAG TPA: ferritin-like protein [Thermoanaerobaculia bacterium]